MNPVSIGQFHPMVHMLDGNSKVDAQSLLFDLFKAFDLSERSHNLDFFSAKRPIILHVCATCSEQPFQISTMVFKCGYPALHYI